MVIEKFKDATTIYRRLRDRGRLMPDGLRYVDSWVSADLKRGSSTRLTARPRMEEEPCMGGNLTGAVEPGTLDFGPRTSDFGPWTLDLGPWTVSAVWSLLSRVCCLAQLCHQRLSQSLLLVECVV